MAKAKIELRLKRGNVNWAAAFMMYSRGLTLHDIATTIPCDYELLAGRARLEGWQILVKESPFILTLDHEEQKKREEEISEQVDKTSQVRSQILEAMQRAAKFCMDTIDETEEGMYVQLKDDDGEMYHTQVPVPAPVKAKIIQSIVSALKSCNEDIAWAHGVEKGSSATNSGKTGNNVFAPTIINLPGVMSQPRVVQNVIEIPKVFESKFIKEVELAIGLSKNPAPLDLPPLPLTLEELDKMLEEKRK